ncbi:MAG: hypothetical protein Q9162_001645 [Coniocarpon cinnabarinum]
MPSARTSRIVSDMLEAIPEVISSPTQRLNAGSGFTIPDSPPAARSTTSRGSAAKLFHVATSDDDGNENFTEVDTKVLKEKSLRTGLTVSYQALCGPAATVFVGFQADNMKKFSVHEGLLCQYSDVFMAAFRGEGHFAEKRTKTFHLHETSPITFSHYVQWLYSHLGTPKWYWLRDGDNFSPASASQLLDLHLLGDFLGDAKLIGVISEALDLNAPGSNPHDMSREQVVWKVPTPEEVHNVYENSDGDARFRAVLVRRYLQIDSNPQVIENPSEYPPQFWYDVSQGWRSKALPRGRWLLE